MTATIESQSTPVRDQPESTGQRPADVFVVFGITGDLAKVMTFRSLYRLERRGLLQCPIVGVAVNDWTVDQLVQRARESIEATGESIEPTIFARFTARLSYVQGDFGDAATYQRVAEAIKDAEYPVFYLEIPPFLFGTVVKGLAEADLTTTRACRRGEAVRKGPNLRSRLGRRTAPVHRRVPALPDRPLPGKDGPGGDPLPAVRQRDVRADLEPQLPRMCADHHGGGLRRRRSGTLLRSRRCAARRGGQSPHAGRSRRAMEPPSGRNPQTIKDSQVALFRAVVEADPANYVRGQYDGYLGISGVAADSTTETYAALRLDIDNWRWSGVPFFIRTGKRLPITQTELRLVFKQPPRLGFGLSADHRPEPDQLVIKLDPSTGIRLRVEARRADSRAPETIHLDMEFAEEGGEGPTPYEVLLHAAMVGQITRFTRQDGVEETWRIMQPLLDAPPPVHPYAPGSWGPSAADVLTAQSGGWHQPWVAQ